MPFLAQKWWHHWRFWSQQLFGKFLESSRNCLVLEALSASWPPYWQYWEEWVIQTPVFQIWKWFFLNRVHSKYFLWFALTYNFYMIIEKWSLIDYQSIQYHSFCLPNRCLTHFSKSLPFVSWSQNSHGCYNIDRHETIEPQMLSGLKLWFVSPTKLQISVSSIMQCMK